MREEEQSVEGDHLGYSLHELASRVKGFLGQVVRIAGESDDLSDLKQLLVSLERLTSAADSIHDFGLTDKDVLSLLNYFRESSQNISRWSEGSGLLKRDFPPLWVDVCRELKTLERQHDWVVPEASRVSQSPYAAMASPSSAAAHLPSPCSSAQEYTPG